MDKAKYWEEKEAKKKAKENIVKPPSRMWLLFKSIFSKPFDPDEAESKKHTRSAKQTPENRTFWAQVEDIRKEWDVINTGFRERILAVTAQMATIGGKVMAP